MPAGNWAPPGLFDAGLFARLILLRKLLQPEVRPWRLGATLFTADPVTALRTD
jgi:hypothetical protein